jgi:hypothetical protein
MNALNLYYGLVTTAFTVGAPQGDVVAIQTAWRQWRESFIELQLTFDEKQLYTEAVAKEEKVLGKDLRMHREFTVGSGGRLKYFSQGSVDGQITGTKAIFQDGERNYSWIVPFGQPFDKPWKVEIMAKPVHGTQIIAPIYGLWDYTERAWLGTGEFPIQYEGKQVVDGHSCEVIRRKDDRLWCDPAVGYLPRKVASLEPFLEVEVRQFTKIDGVLWFPSEGIGRHLEAPRCAISANGN